MRTSAVAAGWLVGLAAPSVAAEVARATREVSGQVVTDEGAALPGAEIAVLDGDRVLLRTSSDATGRFRLSIEADVGAKLQVRATIPGLPVVLAPYAGKPVQLVMRAAASDVGEDALEVDVRGRKESAIAETPPATPVRYAVEGALMTRMPGTRSDPFAAITSLPSMARPPELSTVYVVRGGQPEDSATFVDGAPLLHPFHFGGFVATIPGAMVDSISLAPGGFGAPFGRATAGVIDVGLAAIPRKGVHATASLDAIDVGAVATAAIGDRLRVAIGARRSHVDAWLGALVGSLVAGQLPRYLDGQAIVEFDITSKVRARAGFLASSDDVSVTDPNSPANTPRTGSWHASGMRVHLRVDADDGVKNKAFAVFALSTANDRIVGATDRLEDDRNQLFGRAEATSQLLREVTLTAGADVLGTHIDGQRALSIPISSFGGTQTYTLDGGLTVERIEPAAYLQLSVAPTAGIRFTPGVRLDVLASRELAIEPRFSARVQPDANTALRGSVGLYARANVLDAVDARDVGGVTIPVPADPRSYRTTHVGLGLERSLGGGFSFSIDGWSRFGSGLLVAVQQPARPIWSVDASGARALSGYDLPLTSDQARTRAFGLELLLRATSGRLLGFIGYGLSRSEIRDTQSSPWARSPLDQTHVLNAAAIVDLGAGWEIGARFRLAVGVLDSPYPSISVSPKPDPDRPPGTNVPELPPIHSLDLRLEKTWKIAEIARVSAYVEVRNAYDRRSREPLGYNFVYGYPVVGDGLPIIPNIGVRGAL